MLPIRTYCIQARGDFFLKKKGIINWTFWQIVTRGADARAHRLGGRGRKEQEGEDVELDRVVERAE